MTWIFSNKLLHRRFSRKIFRPPWLENEISAHAQLAITRYYILFTDFQTLYQLETYVEDTP